MANRNEVKVVFTGDASDLNRAIDQAERRASDTAKTLANKTGNPFKEIAFGVESAARQADTQIKRLESRIGQLSPAIIRAREETRKLADSAAALDRIRSSGGGSGGSLTGQQRYGRINLARQGADVFTQLGSGQGVGITAIQQGPQIIEAMAFSGLKLSGAMAATAVSVGVIAAAGYGIVKWSESVRSEAERRLKTEEGIAGAMNRQRLAGIEITKNLKDQLADAARLREFNKFLSGGDINALQRRLDSLTQLQSLGGNTTVGTDAKGNPIGVETESSAQRRSEIVALTAQIEALKSAGGSSSRFADDFKNFQKQQEAAKKKQEEFNESVKKGEERVKELGVQYSNAFSGVFAAAGADNPFVKLYSDADAAAKKFREQTVGLSEDLRKQGLAMIESQNAIGLYKAKLENSFTAFDLRETAAKFRDNSADRRKLRQNSLDRYKSEFERTRSNRNEQANEDYIRRVQRSIDGDLGGDASERLDRQLSNLDRFKPKTAAEAAVFDQKLLSLGSQIDPSQLRGDQRERIAAAAEAQAERTERRQQEALKAQVNSETYLKAINDQMAGFLKVAQTQGLAGVNKLTVEVKDETNNGIGVQKISEPRPQQVADTYDLGFFGGSNR